jgi:hypothetical protein
MEEKDTLSPFRACGEMLGVDAAQLTPPSRNIEAVLLKHHYDDYPRNSQDNMCTNSPPQAHPDHPYMPNAIMAIILPPLIMVSSLRNWTCPDLLPLYQRGSKRYHQDKRNVVPRCQNQAIF